jgi:hypothetical protein
MSRASWTPSIVTADEDETVYLVADDFGRLCRAWREADTVIQDLLTGQYHDPVRVVLQYGRALVGGCFGGCRQRAATPLRSGAAGSLGFRHRFCGAARGRRLASADATAKFDRIAFPPTIPPKEEACILSPRVEVMDAGVRNRRRRPLAG